ncbi:response regulator [Thermodesulfobacteriota bacterium]
MKEIINWLLNMEKLAAELYGRTANKYSEDQEFSTFLSRLAEDEDMHFQLIKNIKQHLLENREHPVSAIVVDKDIKGRVETPLRDLYERILTHEITKQAILKIIANVEFAELNNIFLYVVNTFKKDDREIQHIAATIQSHEERIKKFLDEHPDILDLSEEIRELPSVWKQKLLIVEDIRSVRILFAQILKKFGAVETATNGQEALEKVRDNFFDVIISDIGMPIMSGDEFFQKAIEFDPNIARHFIFCTANITPDIIALCQEHDLMYIEKPAHIIQLREAVQEIIDKNK